MVLMSLLRVTVVGENLINGQRTRSHLWLVDWAGSERTRSHLWLVDWAGSERTRSHLWLIEYLVTLRRDSLDVKEEDYYTSLYNESQAQFNTYVREGTVSNNYAHIFYLLTRLRQVSMAVWRKTKLTKKALFQVVLSY
ncbi:uncharacterized protein LOC116022611 [Ipomoea triloba]|uniref:uncharacterized protein LOC116022611 n=1 Tax=Ipomoea triloba TaxID=35885 RepID=UPI00125E5374|nr:uncharacterized protein LOC116022611 [Ipomoea triloba]